jgi:hypothetical protein
MQKLLLDFTMVKKNNYFKGIINGSITNKPKGFVEISQETKNKISMIVKPVKKLVDNCFYFFNYIIYVF